MSLLANIGRLFLLRITSQVGLMVLIVYFTRALSPSLLGEYFYFESLIGMVSIFAAFGIGGTTEKFISKRDNKDIWYSTGLALLLCFSLAAITVFLAIDQKLYDVLDDKYLGLFCMGLICSLLVTYFRHVFRAELRAAMDGVLDVVRNLLFILISVILVHLDFGPLGVILGAIGGRVLVIPFATTKVNRTFTLPELDKAAEIFHFAKYYFITVVGSKVFHFADVIFIGILLTKADVGRYEIAWRLIGAGIMLNGVIAGTAFSYISQSSAVNDLTQVKDDIEESMRYVLILPLGCVGGAIVIGSELVRELFTSEYVANEALLSVLAVGFVSQAFYFLFSRSLIAINKPKQSLYATVIGVFANIILNVTLIPLFGAIGAGFATTLSFTVGAIAYYLLLKRHIDLSLPWRRFLIQLTGSAVMALLLLVIKYRIGGMSVWSTTSLFIAGGLIYSSFLLTNRRTRDDILNLFEEVSP